MPAATASAQHLFCTAAARATSAALLESALVPPAPSDSRPEALYIEAARGLPTARGGDEELAAPGERPIPLPARRPPAAENAEYGVEFQLAREAAEPFLDRVGTWFKGIVRQATNWLGTPYRRGGVSRRGIDCSGLTGIVFARQGVELPRTAAQQFAFGAAVAAVELQPGDLVFFRNTYKRGISHVGIYIGDGRFIHAAGRRQGVIVSQLARPYYQRRYAGARRHSAPPLETLASLPGGDSPAAPTGPAGLAQ